MTPALAEHTLRDIGLPAAAGWLREISKHSILGETDSSGDTIYQELRLFLIGHFLWDAFEKKVPGSSGYWEYLVSALNAEELSREDLKILEVPSDFTIQHFLHMEKKIAEAAKIPFDPDKLLRRIRCILYGSCSEQEFFG